MLSKEKEYVEHLDKMVKQHVKCDIDGSYWFDDLRDVPLEAPLVQHLYRMVHEGIGIDMALSVIECLIKDRQEQAHIFSGLLPIVEEYILDQRRKPRYTEALAVLYYCHHGNLRQIVTELLKRRVADVFLFNLVKSYDDPSAIALLIQYKDDQEFDEIGMGGPQRFIYRDMAFETIEYLAKKAFLKRDLVGIADGFRCYYYDWAPILGWWAKVPHRDRR
jgi:hypothetical protein